jgi:hypothetical protein
MKKLIYITIIIISILLTLYKVIQSNIYNNLYFRIKRVTFSGLNIGLCFDIFNDTFIRNLNLRNVTIDILNNNNIVLASLYNPDITVTSGINSDVCFDMMLQNISFTNDFFIRIKFTKFGMNFKFILDKNDIINF